MSQQGEKPSDRQEDDGWGDLYADWSEGQSEDPAPAGDTDTVDDRFVSAATVTDTGTSETGPVEPPEAPVPAPRPAEPAVLPPPWQPAGSSTGPRTFRLGRPARARRENAEPGEPPVVAHVGDRPPTYEAEPTALPAADPDALAELVPDTVLDGARYGTSVLRAVSTRGDSARYRGEHRGDALLTVRFGGGDDALVLVALATGARGSATARPDAVEATRWIAGAVGRSHARLAGDIRAARRGDLKSGLHRLTDRGLGMLRARAGEAPPEHPVSLRCLLLPADPACRTRVFFGVGDGGLFRLRDGEWQDIEPRATDAAGEPVMGFGSPPGGSVPDDPQAGEPGIAAPPSPYEPAREQPRDPFRFRASVARPGDTLLLCSRGLAEPLRGERALAAHLTSRWSEGPPGLAAFLADATVRVKGYSDDRTAAAVWEA
ncbi:protein phosphatase 2C domain-containing protein [Streptomyces uncialis]|uniref:protein phosphatase 2C domain-containing protein n=1 Tax=Streptomyces uncialis TaxID=1048205 RepID=UPI00364E2EC1